MVFERGSGYRSLCWVGSGRRRRPRSEGSSSVVVVLKPTAPNQTRGRRRSFTRREEGGTSRAMKREQREGVGRESIRRLGTKGFGLKEGVGVGGARKGGKVRRRDLRGEGADLV